MVNVVGAYPSKAIAVLNRSFDEGHPILDMVGEGKSVANRDARDFRCSDRSSIQTRLAEAGRVCSRPGQPPPMTAMRNWCNDRHMTAQQGNSIMNSTHHPRATERIDI
jgi:hypothetical protein